MSCLSGSFSVAAWRISMNFNDFLVSSWDRFDVFWCLENGLRQMIEIIKDKEE